MKNAKPVLPSQDKRWKIVDAKMRRYGYQANALIETLHSVQQSFGYLDQEALRFVARSLQVPPSKVYGVSTFYHHFSLKPQVRTLAWFVLAPHVMSRARTSYFQRSKSLPGLKRAKQLRTSKCHC
jgi:Thioredoxin-like [2Fe-2S] ferredoxin